MQYHPGLVAGVRAKFLDSKLFNRFTMSLHVVIVKVQD